MEDAGSEQIVVFDFDKTITSIDTFSRLIVYLVNQSWWRQCLALALLPLIFFLNAFHASKPYAVSIGLWVASVGENKRRLVKRIKSYAERHKALGTHDVMRKRAFYSIKLHLVLGHRVVIVSASSRCWIKHMLGPALSAKVTIIGSRLQFRWQGLVLKSWCYGKNKLEHFVSYDVPQQNLRTIYSDSLTDIAMMERARNRCFVNLSLELQKSLEACGTFYYLTWPY